MKNWQALLLIVVAYIAMHVASILMQIPFALYFMKDTTLSDLDIQFHTVAWSLFTANLIAAIVFYILIRRRKNFFKVFRGKTASFGMTILWGIIGFILALVGQMVAGMIEMVAFGIEPGSDNTNLLGEIAQTAPIIIISIVLFAPLLEEIVFRRAIFGGIYTKTNFFIAAIISAFLFAIVHGELEHTLVYMGPAFAFSFIYYKTNRILAPIIGHLLMNAFVVIVQLNQDKIEEWQNLQQSLIMFFQ